MKIRTIIVSYNFRPWMDKCLGSLGHEPETADVWVVDNGSTDGTPDLLRERFPWVTLVENGRNLGFGRANNIAMAQALADGCDAVFLLNQDAWLLPGAMQQMAQVSQAHPDHGVLSPVCLDGSEQRLETGFAHYTRFASLAELPAEPLVTVPFVNAAAWFVTAEAMRRVGLFSPLFYHYGEDKDMANRLAYHGLRMGVATQALACHDRRERPVTRQSFLRSEFVYLLSQYANVRLNPLWAFTLAVPAALKKAAGAFLTGRWSLAADYTDMMRRLHRLGPDVARTRRQSRQVDLANYTMPEKPEQTAALREMGVF